MAESRPFTVTGVDPNTSEPVETTIEAASEAEALARARDLGLTNALVSAGPDDQVPPAGPSPVARATPPPPPPVHVPPPQPTLAARQMPPVPAALLHRPPTLLRLLALLALGVRDSPARWP